MPGSSTRSRRPQHKSDRSKSKHHGSSHGSSGRPGHSFSFLFVVNEFIIDYDYGDGSASRDEWFNNVPPSTYHKYAHEIRSTVMRYRDGKVSEASAYHFDRDETPPGQPKAQGIVWAYCSDGSTVDASLYSSFTVFACNPLLPIVVAEGDPSTYSDVRYHPLQFFHPSAEHPLRGISQAAYEDSPMGQGGAPVKYVAGQSPSWMPALVPESYRNPYRHTVPPSIGLAGELPIVIGLMAFSEARGESGVSNRVNEIFLGRPGHNGRWRDRRWTHNHRPAGYPATAQDDPRGFLVAVFLDPENPGGSTFEALEFFEWEDVIVTES